MIEINRYVMHSKDCGDAFDRMFWACFWGLDFHVSIQGLKIDLLLDFLGWMMVVSAFTSILDLSPVVSKLRIYASILLVLSLSDFVQLEDGASMFGAPAHAWDLATGLLLLVLIWSLAGLIRAMANSVGEDDIASKAHLYRMINVVLVLVVPWLPLQYLRPLELLFWVGAGILGLAFVTWILMMKLLKDTAAMCRRLR